MERQFPKNVRQIGNVSDEPKIYMEDYVDTYLNQLRPKAIDSPVAALLTGEIVEQEGQAVVYISGALQIEAVEVTGTEIRMDEEIWKRTQEEREMHFPEQQAVGWCVIETGHPMGLNQGAGELHKKLFEKENTVFVWRDALETDEIFYACKYGELMQMGGHYIYYERNPTMQSYMIRTRKENGVTPSELVEDRAAKNFRSTVKNKKNYREQRQSSRFSYAMSVFLVVVVLAIGISTMNNVDKMRSVQKSLDMLSMSIGKTEETNGTVKEAENNKENKQNQENKTKEKTGDNKTNNKETENPKKTENEQQKTKQEESTDSITAGKQVQEDYYTVQRGDTLDKISVKLYGTANHVEAICKMNGLTDGNLIYIGQKLLLP